MKVIRSDVLGYCFGVRRAVELAQKVLDEKSDEPVYSLGPLIHNETVLKRFEQNGLKITQEDELESIEDGATVIIRAHGVYPEIINQLEQKNCKIVDATCPRVKASQKAVIKRHGYKILFTGDSNHGEVKGIAGYAGSDFLLIESVHDAEELKLDGNKKNVLLSQTTFSQIEFEKIKNILVHKDSDIEVINTICPATKERQDALIELCSKVEGVIVIGGKNSANTKRLFQLALDNCSKAVHIEDESEIPEEYFKMQYVGVTAGASTPDDLIDAVVQKFNQV